MLANRLSADANVSVLLIEAGTRFGLLAEVPLLALAQQKSTVDWSLVSTPQRHSSRGLIDRRQFLPRGKGLGGSSQLNYALHFNGADRDFDAWSVAGWGSQTMRQYLRRIADEKRVYSEPPAPEGLWRVFDAMRTEMGAQLPHLQFDAAASNTRKGVRWSTYKTYLRPAFERPNLQILYGTRAHRVLFGRADRRTDGGQRRARAIRVSDEARLLHADEDDADNMSPGARGTHTIRASREIILCTGAYGTPQLLQLSGIGPAELLDRLHIRAVADSPHVGRNLHEHLTVPLFVSINESLSMTTAKMLNPLEWWRYVRHGAGFLARFGVIGFVADPRAHHAFGVFAAGSMDESVLCEVANTRRDVFRGQFPLYRNGSQEGFVLLHTCHQPRSRGSVMLAERSVRTAPLIDPNFLAEEADVECIGRSIRLAARMMRSRAMRGIGVRYHWPRLKECQNFGPFEADDGDDEADVDGGDDGDDIMEEGRSDRYLECVMRTIGVTAHHPGGTCAMGTNADSCVDERLRYILFA